MIRSFGCRTARDREVATLQGSHAGHHLDGVLGLALLTVPASHTAMWKSLGTTNSLEISIANSAAGPNTSLVRVPRLQRSRYPTNWSPSPDHLAPRR